MAETPVDAGYYENDRPEIAALVPQSALTILDVGCGKGRLGALLRRDVPGRKVYGIEYVPSIASEAENVLDGVIIDDLQTMRVAFPLDFFDCMIFADVLEHLPDPESVLRKLKPHLKNGGSILCSIPNIRHYTALQKLILHGWKYDDYGLFDRTHVRFFSLKTMNELLTGAGFTVERAEPRIVASRKMRTLNAVLFGHLDEFLAMQYLLLARPSR